MDSTTRGLLVGLADIYEREDFIVGDPSWWMHQVQGDRNREATAFVASALSYGSRSQFMPKIGQLVDYAGGDVDGWLRSGAYRERFAHGDGGCYYRLYSCEVMASFFDAYRTLLTECGSLGEMVGRQGDGTGLGAVRVICLWFARHGGVGVIPKDTTSACKRVCMFLRWMVRDHSPVDLGLWAHLVDKRTLVMPMDTHVLTEAMRLGLLQNRVATMRTAQKLTEVMAEVFPDDPLRGDFALFGYGVSSTTA